MSKVFLKDLPKKPCGAIFMSGSGTNAEKILDWHVRLGTASAWRPALIVTDRPKTSRAREIAGNYNLPLVEHGIVSFYRAHGLDSVTLATDEGRRVRDLWTDELRAKIAPFHIDFGILAGFVPLTNLVGEIPCLNVHPGDLTFEKNGRRHLVGLHSVPLELAILEGHSSLRSSVILVQPYTPGAAEMDSGHILGISEPVSVDLEGHSLEELRAIFARRKNEHRHGANLDLLYALAEINQEHLKRKGDWTLYPKVVEDFARGCFAEAEDGSLLWRENPDAPFLRVKTVEYAADGCRPVVS